MSGPEFVITEPTAWCRMTAARRVRQLRRMVPAGVLVMAGLGDQDASPGSAEDRTCDHCRTYVPDSGEFLCAVVAIERFRLVVGLCWDCAVMESPRWAAAVTEVPR